MREPLVSIVVACYNGQQFIESQMLSLASQTYSNLEVIIVDDASSDGSYEYLEKYVKSYPNYSLVRNSVNLGLVATFEIAINIARGEYIALCDQDDIWFPNKIEQLMANIGNNWLIHSDANLIDETGQIIKSSYFNSCKHHINSYAQYLIENNVTGCTALFKRELFNLIGNKFPLGTTVHDRVLAILASKQDKLIYLNLPLMSYRQHANNQVGAISQTSITVSAQRHLLDLDALTNLDYFNNDVDLYFAQQYYNVILKRKPINYKLMVWIQQKFGWIWLLKYLVKLIIK
jgi:glycosyltransferase involved in cell wall biosynthesis